MKRIKAIFLLLYLVLCVFLLPINVYASDIDNTVNLLNEERVMQEETATEREDNNDINDARNGILQVDLVYVDEENDVYPVHGGSGFLIGNDEGAEYVITSYENITVTDELRNSIGKELGIKKADRKNMQFAIQVVVKRDVVVEAEVTTYSEQINFAVLHLAQTIYDRKPLQLEKETEEIQEMETVYTLGFPETIQNEQDVSYYTYEDVSVMNGIVSKKTSIDGALYIQHSAVITNGNSGGPLINQFGHVIGVNQMSIDDGYHYSVHISEITAVLDALGIPYTEALIDPVVEIDIEPLQEALSLAKSINLENYTEESAEQFKTIIYKVEELIESENITDKDIENGLTMLETANAMLVEKNSNYLSIIVISVMVLLLTIIIVLSVIIIKKNGRKTDKSVKKEKKKSTTVTYEDFVAESPLKKAEPVQETSVLSSAMGFDEGETTILNGSMMINGVTATLRRLKSNETIRISENVFYIGKDGLKTNYCIKGNPSVSRCHAVIKQIGGEFYLEDLQATNGTYHNDLKLQPSQSVKLMSGDRIRLANEEFVFSV